VVKDVEDEYSDIEWEDVVGGVEREAVKQVVVVVTQGKESHTKVKLSQENQLRGVDIGEERMRLIKGNIMGNLNATSNRIPTAISRTLRVVTKKNTLDQLCR
jgi:hypothetical protein